MNHPLQDALPADVPSLELSAEDRLYEPLIGSWSVRAVDYLDDGSKREDAGEWHFGYVLEGRAVQDVWILPSRSRRTPDTPKEYNRYGTSIRSFHPKKKRWELTWINPVSGARDLLVARREGGDIVQEGRGDDGSLIRWVFTDITESSARWYGESSTDGGTSWKLGAEFFLKRTGDSPQH
jgi:hypothetical protein